MISSKGKKVPFVGSEAMFLKGRRKKPLKNGLFKVLVSHSEFYSVADVSRWRPQPATTNDTETFLATYIHFLLCFEVKVQL